MPCEYKAKKLLVTTWHNPYTEKEAIIRHCSADSEIAIDRVDDLFYTTGPNLLLLRGAHHVRTG